MNTGDMCQRLSRGEDSKNVASVKVLTISKGVPVLPQVPTNSKGGWGPIQPRVPTKSEGVGDLFYPGFPQTVRGAGDLFYPGSLQTVRGGWGPILHRVPTDSKGVLGTYSIQGPHIQ